MLGLIGKGERGDRLGEQRRDETTTDVRSGYGVPPQHRVRTVQCLYQGTNFLENSSGRCPSLERQKNLIPVLLFRIASPTLWR